MSSKPGFQTGRNRLASKGRVPLLACGRLLSVHAVAVDKVKVGAGARVSFARFRASSEGKARFLCEGRSLCARVRCFGAALPLLRQTARSKKNGG